MKFSIIMPIYKVEMYLRESIESVLNQPYGDFELILVDDGSPDKCPEICDDYKKKDSRIRVVHKKNEGLSAARNTGLLMSQGEYIIFIDSDDVLCFNVLAKISDILDAALQPDILIGNIIHWDGDNEKIIVNNTKYIKKKKQETILELNELYAKDNVQIPWRAYQSIYNREFLLKNQLIFDENLIGAEDCDFYLKVIKRVENYFLTEVSFVKYRIGREGSIINTPSYRSVIGQLETFANAFDYAEDFPDSGLMKKYFANRYTNIIIQVNMLQDKQDRERCFCFIEEHREILNFTSRKMKYIFAKLIWRMLGFSKGSEILLKINEIRKP